MKLPKDNCSVLYVSYPMLPVSEASCGGAEQMLWVLEREMNARGWRTVVAGCEGSSVNGELFSTGEAPRKNDSYELREVEHSRKVLAMLHASNGDLALVHDKSGEFWKHAEKMHHPLLVTLHLPRSFYPESLFNSPSRNVYFNCVSTSQAKSFNDLPRMLGVVQNGIPLERFRLQDHKKDYLLWLGRICPEKGVHLAIEAAKRAGIPLVIAGEVYPFSYHQRYFDRDIKPHLEEKNSQVKFVRTPTFAEKGKLLSNARGLLIPSLADETSSLVAMEAMACGTPVVGFRRGALPEVVKHGATGFIVDSVGEMVIACRKLDGIRPEDCRAQVEERFCSRRMAEEYEALYDEVCSGAEEALGLAA